MDQCSSIFAPTNTDAKSGCNLTGGGSQLVLGVSSSDITVATVSPSTITITACDPTLSSAITVHAVGAGSATVSATFTSVTTGSAATSASDYNLTPASFTVDVTAPTSDTAPPVITHSVGTPKYVNGSDTHVTSATTLNFNVNEADHGNSGLKSCTVAVDGPSTNDGSFTCAEGDNNYTLSTNAPLSLASHADGSYANTANATDDEDNVATEDSFTVILDNTGPTFGNCTGGPFYLGSGNQAVSITANDTGSGLDASSSRSAAPWILPPSERRR